MSGFAEGFANKGGNVAKSKKNHIASPWGAGRLENFAGRLAPPLSLISPCIPIRVRILGGARTFFAAIARLKRIADATQIRDYRQGVRLCGSAVIGNRFSSTRAS